MSQGQGGGRPPKLTPELHTAIVDDIAAAIPYEYAAGANGICETTLYAWKRQGDEDLKNGLDTPHSRFSQDIKKAERSRINKHLKNITSGDDKWVCDAWILERRWWKHYSKNAPLLEFQKQLDEMKQQMENDNGKGNA